MDGRVGGQVGGWMDGWRTLAIHFTTTGFSFPTAVMCTQLPLLGRVARRFKENVCQILPNST